MSDHDFLVDALCADPLARVPWQSGLRVRIGASACLLGEKVRYDGDHRLARLVATLLPPVAVLVPLCPEVAIGLGVPRPAIQRVRLADGTDIVRGSAQRALIISDRLDQYAAFVAQNTRLHGYVFKARSPSCAPGNAPVFNEQDVQIDTGWGRYAERLRAAYPDMPIRDEEALATLAQVTAFLVACYRYAALDAPPDPAVSSPAHRARS